MRDAEQSATVRHACPQGSSPCRTYQTCEVQVLFSASNAHGLPEIASHLDWMMKLGHGAVEELRQ